eukprot:3567289-Pleurochrysis_carterae.AAC.1
MLHAGVHMLHLFYLNLFKHLSQYSVYTTACQLLSRLSVATNYAVGTKKKLVRDYLRNAGLYSYDAASVQEENPEKRWIGREVKRLLQEAHLHLPFLLRVAGAPPDMCPDIANHADEQNELAMDIDEDDEYAPSAEDLSAEEEEEPLMMANAAHWDRFFAFGKAIQRPLGC